MRLSADPDNERAEYAIVVRDDLSGAGLGTILMERMLAYAWARGIREVFGDVLADNRAMLAICRKLGFNLHQSAGSSGLVRVAIGPPTHS